MPRNNAIEDPFEQRAVRAWSQLHPEGPEPEKIETLKATSKSAVYRLEGVGLGGSAVVAKRCSRATGVVEQTIHEQLLPRLSVSALRYYGFLEEEDGQFCWFFLEDACGEEFSPYEEGHCVLAALWLAHMHTSASHVASLLPLPDRGPNHYLEQLRLACSTIQRNLAKPGLTAEDRSVLESIISHCEVLESRWRDLVDRYCAGVPCTLVHGDFVEKNVRVRSGPNGTDLFALDWEVAGWAVPAADLAQCPDINAYGSVVRQFWPHLDIQDLQRLAQFGRICRLLASISWASSRLDYESMAKPMRPIRVYEPALAAALRTVTPPTKPVKVHSPLPDLRTLTAGLASVFGANGASAGEVTVVGRQPCLFGTFPKEIVTCRFKDGTARPLLCKYAPARSDSGYGHRGGLRYEAEVYRHVLQGLQLTTATFYGAHTDLSTDETWLVLEYLDQSERSHEAQEPSEATALAARWIGRFHAANEARISSGAFSFLKKYDAEYYLGWARRTSLFARELHKRFPWLAALCQSFEEVVSYLFRSPLTVIHGEYTPKNILIRDGVVYPVDWESAAAAAGEIDLACLTQRWSTEIVRECELEYQQARWGGATPADFNRRLAAARLCLCFRWLGDQPEWTVSEGSLRYFEQMRSLGEELGLI